MLRHVTENGIDRTQELYQLQETITRDKILFTADQIDSVEFDRRNKNFHRRYNEILAECSTGGHIK
ncbi:MAG: hypothetical protein ACTSYA_03800 [Candidatus Kariarchaeaceae archaeon]